ncbi:SOS response-associated peptidase [Erythrobacter colymbi]|uniref:SOS response-associated peptidase n=1 Tax=Erythrobacter colymbi TaxID=1161202 RepID=UPI000A3C277B|nr:SOS response-associated peptidase family protein [Erythrobacter colymbi]
MCHLTRITKPTGEVAAWFDAVERLGGANLAAETYPGTPGLVIAEGELRAMTWGFPLVLKGAKGQPLKPKPVNNARDDKLGTAFWRESFVERRCLIPLTGWGEAEGARGRMTRTWLALPDAPLFAAAGMWRSSDEWGDCYTMVMTDSAGTDAASVHERMPVLLAPDDYACWTGGTPDAAFRLCRGWEGPLAIDRTNEPWAKAATAPAPPPPPVQPGLF